MWARTAVVHPHRATRRQVLRYPRRTLRSSVPLGLDVAQGREQGGSTGASSRHADQRLDVLGQLRRRAQHSASSRNGAIGSDTPRFMLWCMEANHKPCRLCLTLSQQLETARTIGHPDLLLGLTEAGKRNRLKQTQEKIAKAEMDLQKHQKAHHKDNFWKVLRFYKTCPATPGLGAVVHECGLCVRSCCA